MSDERDIDMIAAAMRADASDLERFLDVTATKFEDALPDHTVVERAGWLDRRRGRVREVRISLGEELFALARRGRDLEAAVSHVVHGVTLATTKTDVDDWLTRLTSSLARYADGQARGREALERLLR